MSAQSMPIFSQSLIPSDAVHLITLAAAILMAANQNLTPDDAVGDAAQAYQHALAAARGTERGTEN